VAALSRLTAARAVPGRRRNPLAADLGDLVHVDLDSRHGRRALRLVVVEETELNAIVAFSTDSPASANRLPRIFQRAAFRDVRARISVSPWARSAV
jgi:hypothetical protein